MQIILENKIIMMYVPGMGNMLDMHSIFIIGFSLNRAPRASFVFPNQPSTFHLRKAAGIYIIPFNQRSVGKDTGGMDPVKLDILSDVVVGADRC